MDNFIFLPARSRKNAGNSATGKLSVALGQHCTASGEYSLADGSGCIASTACSVALGNAADASNTCGFMYRDMCGNTFCFDSGGHDLSGQLLINGKPIGGTQEATYGKIIVEQAHIYKGGQTWLASTEDHTLARNSTESGALPSDGQPVSLKQLLEAVGVTTRPKWVRMTLIGAGGGGGCGRGGGQGGVRGGGGGGSGAIAIVESSGNLAEAAWDASHSLSVGVGGWYLAYDDATGGEGTGDLGVTNTLIQTGAQLPLQDYVYGQGPRSNWDFTWTSTTGTEWGPNGGDCTWDLLGPNFGVSGGGGGRGPAAANPDWFEETWDVSNPLYEPTGGFRGLGGAAPTVGHGAHGAMITGLDTAYWRGVAAWPGNDGKPWVAANAMYGTSSQNGRGADAIGWLCYHPDPGFGAACEGGDYATPTQKAGGGAFRASDQYENLLGPEIMPVWGIGGRTSPYSTNPAQLGGQRGGSAMGYGAGGAGDSGGGQAGTHNYANDWTGVLPGGAGAGAALIIEWGPSPPKKGTSS